MRIAEQKRCTGCGACSDACPAACISMRTSEEGFLFPVIDESRCTGCGVCGRVCHALNPPEKRVPGKAFAAWTLDRSVRTSSSSGGVYSVLGEHVLENGVTISGCRFDKDMVLKHELAAAPAVRRCSAVQNMSNASRTGSIAGSSRNWRITKRFFSQRRPARWPGCWRSWGVPMTT